MRAADVGQEASAQSDKAKKSMSDRNDRDRADARMMGEEERSAKHNLNQRSGDENTMMRRQSNEYCCRMRYERKMSARYARHASPRLGRRREENSYEGSKKRSDANPGGQRGQNNKMMELRARLLKETPGSKEQRDAGKQRHDASTNAVSAPRNDVPKKPTTEGATQMHGKQRAPKPNSTTTAKSLRNRETKNWRRIRTQGRSNEGQIETAYDAYWSLINWRGYGEWPPRASANHEQRRVGLVKVLERRVTGIEMRRCDNAQASGPNEATRMHRTMHERQAEQNLGRSHPRSESQSNEGLPEEAGRGQHIRSRHGCDSQSSEESPDENRPRADR